MHDIQRGAFVDRPNRFIAHVALDGDIATCHMPNPGRMWELLFPGVAVYIRPAANPKRRTAYDVVGIERDGIPILLDTQSIMIRRPGWSRNTASPAGKTGTSSAGKSPSATAASTSSWDGEKNAFSSKSSRVPFSAETAPCSPMPSPNGAESISWN